MIHVVVGTDSYGRVKRLGKTAVVTTFSMAQLLPLWPVKSYYVWGQAMSEAEGIPYLASIRKVALRGCRWPALIGRPWDSHTCVRSSPYWLSAASCLHSWRF